MSQQNQEKIPLWLDCDPGHDDAFAIILALYHPRLNLLGISTVHGNAPLSHTTNNALRILTALSPTAQSHCSYSNLSPQSKQPLYAHSHPTNLTWPVNVFPGASSPICRQPQAAAAIHGVSGLDGTDLLPEADRKALKQGNVVREMRDAVMGCPAGKAWLVATGALTNIALLFMVYPEVMTHIEGLSLMGGSVGDGFADVIMAKDLRRGNWVEWAEFNTFSDPEASHRVLTLELQSLHSPLKNKTTMCTLDLTHQVRVSREIRERILNGRHPSSGSGEPSKLRRMFYELLEFFAKKYSDVFGLDMGEGPPLHDPLAVAVLLETLIEADGEGGKVQFDDRGGERWDVDVLLEGEVGRTVVRKAESGGGDGGIKIPRAVDKEKFWDVLEGCLDRADEATRGSKVWEQ